jgi:hypothetical protein
VALQPIQERPFLIVAPQAASPRNATTNRRERSIQSLIKLHHCIIRSMEQPKYKPGLIHNKREAVIALCLTGFVAATTVWGAVSRSFHGAAYRSLHKLPWLLDLRFMLPTRAALAVNVGFYAYLFYLGVAFYRMAQGKERVLVAGWFVGIFLGPVQILVSVPAAAIDYMQAAGMMGAFLAAVYILVEVSASTKTLLDNQPSQRSRDES